MKKVSGVRIDAAEVWRDRTTNQPESSGGQQGGQRGGGRGVVMKTAVQTSVQSENSQQDAKEWQRG